MIGTVQLPKDAKVLIDEKNKRVKLLACGEDPAAAGAAAIAAAQHYDFGKIWGFVSPDDWNVLAPMGFVREGTLEGYYPDAPGVGIAHFLDDARRMSKHSAEEDMIIAMAASAEPALPAPLPAGYLLRAATREDASQVSRVLKTVFSSYPTPIDTAEDIVNAMAQDVHFYGVEHEGRLVSVASADMDAEHAVAEMTDCATLPEYRGQGLMGAILYAMENDMREKFHLRSVFTLARATIAPMNKAFARLGYAYTGRFINNCHIGGDWEDMNLWVKSPGADLSATESV